MNEVRDPTVVVIVKEGVVRDIVVNDEDWSTMVYIVNLDDKRFHVSPTTYVVKNAGIVEMMKDVVPQLAGEDVSGMFKDYLNRCEEGGGF